MQYLIHEDQEYLVENTKKIADLLIENIQVIQQLDHVQELKRNQPKHFLKEFSTIKIYGPRQMGHSSTIPYIVYKYKLNPLIITENSRLLNYLIEKFLRLNQHKKNHQKRRLITYENNNFIYFSTIDQVVKDIDVFSSISIPNVDSIIIDTSTFIKGKYIEEIYDFFSHKLSISKMNLFLLMQ